MDCTAWLDKLTAQLNYLSESNLWACDMFPWSSATRSPRSPRTMCSRWQCCFVRMKTMTWSRNVRVSSAAKIDSCKNNQIINYFTNEPREIVERSFKTKYSRGPKFKLFGFWTENFCSVVQRFRFQTVSEIRMILFVFQTFGLSTLHRSETKLDRFI